MISWLLRYSRLLEDRVRFHWAARAFLWFVTVPTHLVAAKQEQYRQPPEAGSIVVADDAEQWEVKAPRLNGADASPDLEAVRRMVFTGSGFPPHWFGEKGSNRAEASAMQGPAERHLRRRQQYFVWLLEDVVYHAYQRARAVRPTLPALPTASYRRLFAAAVPDISRQDNAERALAAYHLTEVWRNLVREAEPQSRRLAELLLAQVFRFMGEPQEAGVIKRVVDRCGGAIAGQKPLPRLMANGGYTGGDLTERVRLRLQASGLGVAGLRVVRRGDAAPARFRPGVMVAPESLREAAAAAFDGARRSSSNRLEDGRDLRDMAGARRGRYDEASESVLASCTLQHRRRAGAGGAGRRLPPPPRERHPCPRRGRLAGRLLHRGPGRRPPRRTAHRAAVGGHRLPSAAGGRILAETVGAGLKPTRTEPARKSDDVLMSGLSWRAPAG